MTSVTAVPPQPLAYLTSPAFHSQLQERIVAELVDLHLINEAESLKPEIADVIWTHWSEVTRSLYPEKKRNSHSY